MERLDCLNSQSYSAIEAAIHIGRYAPMMPLCPGKRVLDVACGEGYGAYLLKMAGASTVDALDVSAEAVTRAQQLFQAEGLTYTQADAHRVAEIFPPKSFDIVTSIETLEHLSDPVAFLRGLRDVCKDDGLIYLTCPNDHFYYQETESNPYHIRKYTFAEFKDLAQSVLGGDVRWYYGTAVGGFASLAIDESPYATDADLSPYAQIRELNRVQLVPADGGDRVNPERSSYFMGVWNGGGQHFGSGAVYPMSMDSYARLHSGANSAEELKRVVEQYHRLVEENQRTVLELNRMVEENQRLQKFEQEMSIWRAQATAMRHENDILLESVQNQKGTIAAQINEINDLRSLLDATQSTLNNIRNLVPGFLKPVLRRLYRLLRR